MTIEALRKQACCFTGHREIPLLFHPLLKRRLEATVRRLADEGIVYFIAGGALGFDTMAAETVLRLQETDLPHVRLLLAIPCEGQDKSWPEADKQRYAHIKSRAHAVTVLSDHYFTGCMQARNRYMVDRASVCVCYMTKTSGGTAGTGRYAEKKGLPVVNLA
ncbi:MAG: DUF1273 family protein [Clostridia bacterium]|nr:DUF1273 family protein [Clostridia bacterium]